MFVIRLPYGPSRAITSPVRPLSSTVAGFRSRRTSCFNRGSNLGPVVAARDVRADGRENISAMEGGGNFGADHPVGVGDLANGFRRHRGPRPSSSGRCRAARRIVRASISRPPPCANCPRRDRLPPRIPFRPGSRARRRTGSERRLRIEKALTWCVRSTMRRLGAMPYMTPLQSATESSTMPKSVMKTTVGGGCAADCCAGWSPRSRTSHKQRVRAECSRMMIKSNSPKRQRRAPGRTPNRDHTYSLLRHHSPSSIYNRGGNKINRQKSMEEKASRCPT